MNIHDSENLLWNDPHQDWPDIWMPNGHRLTFYSNIVLPTGVEDQEEPFDNYAANEYDAFRHLASRGVVAIPELPATDMQGEVKPHAAAVYVDTKIGIEKLGTLIGIDGWVSTQEPRLADYPDQEKIPYRHLAALLDRGIKETGIATILEQMRAEDAARPQTAVPEVDIDGVMRSMRDSLRQNPRLDTGFDET
jgi:hypothetical protein